MNIDAIAYLEKVRAIINKFPAVSEAQCYGTPGFYVHKKLFARLKEDGESLVVHTEDRDMWMQKSPAIYYITDHYLSSPMYVLIHLSKIKQKELEAQLLASWKLRAPKKILKEFEENTKCRSENVDLQSSKYP